MTLETYLEGPVSRDYTKMHLQSSDDKQHELDLLFIEMRGKINVVWYKIDEILIAHVKVPSKSIDSLQYDVILQFDTSRIQRDENATINNAAVKVFSNCPSFIFTYAYIFNKNGDLCSWTRSKYDREVLAFFPKEKNRYEIIGHERSLYLAFKYISLDNRNNLKRIERYSVRMRDVSGILRRVKSGAEIASERERLKLEKNRKEEYFKNVKSKIHSQKRPVSEPKVRTGLDGYTKSVQRTNKVGKTSATKKTKRI